MIYRNSCFKTGAYILLDSLVQNNVEHIFGYPGGAILPIYDELYYWEKENLIKHILVRHEQSAAHAADAYARSSNKPGVCFATSGPGATNLVTGIATAQMDSIPLIIITGQVARNFIGTNAFQETDIFGITLPIVKHSYTVRNAKDLPEILSEAFYLAQNGRPGPVLIDIPKDVGLEEVEKYDYVNVQNLLKRKNYKNDLLSPKIAFSRFLMYLNESYQPLCYVGGGLLRANGYKALEQLAKIYQIPITTTLMGKSSYNESDHLSLGMLGMHGTAYANFSVSECDLLISLGARFDDRVTGKLEEFACDAEVIHLDIDSSEISKNRSPQLALIGDGKKILNEFLKFLRKISLRDISQTKNWLKRIYKWKKLYPLFTFDSNSVKMSAQEAIFMTAKNFPSAIFTTDVGQHQMWSAQLVNTQPKKWLSSSGLGTMGFGLPAAIGAKVANPNQEVICISGDSSIQMSIQELGTISQYQLGLRIIIINNGWQGMVRQWQESFYGNRFSNSYMRNGMPDFFTLAQAYGIKGAKIRNLTNLKYFLEEIKDDSFSYLIDVQVIEDENCYPMVAPGRSNSQMLGLENYSLHSNA